MNDDVAALPHRPRVGEQRARHEQRRLGVAHAERGEPLRAPPPARGGATSPGTTASTRWTRDEVLGRQHRRRRARRTRRGTPRRARARSSAPRRRGGRRGAAGRRAPRRARRGGRRRGSSGPSRCPRRRRARSAPPGRWWRSAIREATMPITPGCQPSAASTYAAGSAPPARAAATCASASKRIRVSTSRRSTLTRSSSAADRARPLDVGGQQQLEPGVGAVQPPGGVDPRREPEPDRARVDPARVDARDLHQRLQPGLARRRERAQPLAHEPPVLVHERHAVGHGGERDEVEVGVGRAPGPCRPPRAAPARAGARRRPRTARGTGSRRPPDGRSARRAARRRRAARGGR